MHIHMEGFDQYQKLRRGPRYDSESKTGFILIVTLYSKYSIENCLQFEHY
jgi:hypothetical protein